MAIDRPFAGTSHIANAGRSLSRSVAVLALLSLGHAANAQTTLPPDVKPTCTVSQQEFNRWFLAQGVEKDGLVLPANSLAFNGAASGSENEFCAFYKWSAQMLLWLLSPLPPAFNDGTHIFDSSTFFEVSPLDADGRRTLKPHIPGQLRSFSPSISQRGNRGQEVVVDSTGKLRDVVRPETGPDSALLFRDTANQAVEIARIATAANGKPLLLDKVDKAVDVATAPNGAPLLRDVFGKAINLAPTTVLVNGRPRLVTTAGDVVGVEQAGNAALMTRSESLVYYLIEVNDVYAYFNTGMKNQAIANPTPAEFPATVPALTQIKNFAANVPPPNAKTSFPDEIAMAFEVKSSWIEVAGSVNAADYVTIKASVPAYTRSADNTRLVQSATPREVTLALVGIHVVGSTLGHPEMIWATFEHVNNTPNPQYAYKNAADAPVTKLADAAGPWQFSTKDGNPSSMGAQRMQLDPANRKDLVALGAGTIGGSDVVRLAPWGTASTDAKFIDNNTAVLSINRSVIGKLREGDVRKNYIMVGATFTSDGKGSTGANDSGTNTLANSTMETFQQDSNCFGCHSGDMLGSKPGSDGFTGGLSHIWDPIKPLFPKQ